MGDREGVLTGHMYYTESGLEPTSGTVRAMDPVNTYTLSHVYTGPGKGKTVVIRPVSAYMEFAFSFGETVNR